MQEPSTADQIIIHYKGNNTVQNTVDNNLVTCHGFVIIKLIPVLGQSNDEFQPG